MNMVFSRLFSRRSFLTLVAVAVIATSLCGGTAKADQAEAARKFIQNLGDKAISTLADKNVSPEQAGKIFHDMLVESFDLDLLGKFAIGPTNWRAASPQQRQEYLKLFEKLVVQIYSDRFSLYNGETWKVTDAKVEDDRDTYVSGLIVKPNPSAPAVKVDWRVRNKGGREQVIDVIVEGVSMSVTQRSEFTAVLQKNGGDIDAFLKILQDRVATQTAQVKD